MNHPPINFSSERDRQLVFHSASRPAISDRWHAIEIEWQAASTAGANDGRFSLRIDGILKDELTGMDFTPLDSVRLGAVDKVDATTQGVYNYPQKQDHVLSDIYAGK